MLTLLFSILYEYVRPWKCFFDQDVLGIKLSTVQTVYLVIDSNNRFPPICYISVMNAN